MNLQVENSFASVSPSNFYLSLLASSGVPLYNSSVQTSTSKLFAILPPLSRCVSLSRTSLSRTHSYLPLLIVLNSRPQLARNCSRSHVARVELHRFRVALRVRVRDRARVRDMARDGARVGARMGLGLGMG
eukprot:1372338-Amorphochlora_amoeboformis.AAC.1